MDKQPNDRKRVMLRTIYSHVPDRLLDWFKPIRFRVTGMVKCLLGRNSFVLERGRPLTDEIASQIEPIFVLSTGRCGTKWLTETLSLSRQVFVNHALPPELIRQSKLAYETHFNTFDCGQLVEIVRAARDDFISAAYDTDRIYIETNNRITFFAWAISQAYPRSKFIHLYRHPADFVRSGMRRNWYSGRPDDLGRIESKNTDQWKGMSQFEQIAWLWNETNSFIQSFLESIPSDRWMSVRSEQLFSDSETTLQLCNFSNITDIPVTKIEKMLNKRVNIQERGYFPKYHDWSPQQKELLCKWCPLASQYGINLDI
jgi:hypothetical protein